MHVATFTLGPSSEPSDMRHAPPPLPRPAVRHVRHTRTPMPLAHRLTPSFEFEIRTPQPSDPAIKFSPFRRKRRGTEREGDPVCNRRPAVLRLRVPTAAAGPG
jgi:hypothetical protein